MFEIRGQGVSQTEVSEATGIKHSTVVAVLKNRAYIGEMRHKDEWLPGNHEPLVTVEQFEAAHRGRVPGRKLQTSGQGLQAATTVESWPRGCSIAGNGTAVRRRTAKRDPPGRLAELRRQRDKLLMLHLDDKISADQFGEQQARITTEIENLEYETTNAVEAQLQAGDLSQRFEDVAELLTSLNVSDLWEHADESERRTLLDELLQDVTVHPDRLPVTQHGATTPTLHSPKSGSKTRS